MAGGNLNWGNVSSDWSVCGLLIIFLIVDWCARIQLRVGSATPRQVVQGSTRKVQERRLNVSLAARQWAALLRPHLPLCLSSFLLWCPHWQAIIRSTLSSRVAFGHGASPSKGEQLRQQLSVQRRGEAKMLSLLHHCAGTLSPEKAASLPPESFPIFSTPPNETTTHSFRWGWEKQWQEVKRIQFRTKKFPVKAELNFF